MTKLRLMQQRFYTNQAEYAEELDAIGHADFEARTAADRLSEAVSTARTAGCSWEAIGSILGVTRQAAQQRFRD